MKTEPIILPEVFNFENETNKVLQSKKKSIRNFKFTTQASLIKVNGLIYLLFVFGRLDEAYEVCKFMSMAEFNGNYNLWSWVETTLALQARILRESGRLDEAKKVIEKIEKAGYSEGRLKGDLLCNEDIEGAIRDNDKSLEKDYRLIELQELCFIIEVGRYKLRNVDEFEEVFNQNLSELKKIFKV